MQVFVIIRCKIQIRSNMCIKIWEPSHYPSVRGEKRAQADFLTLREFLATPIICSIDIRNILKSYLLKANYWISLFSWWIRKPFTLLYSFCSSILHSHFAEQWKAQKEGGSLHARKPLLQPCINRLLFSGLCNTCQLPLVLCLHKGHSCSVFGPTLCCGWIRSSQTHI